MSLVPRTKTIRYGYRGETIEEVEAYIRKSLADPELESIHIDFFHVPSGADINAEIKGRINPDLLERLIIGPTETEDEKKKREREWETWRETAPRYVNCGEGKQSPNCCACGHHVDKSLPRWCRDDEWAEFCRSVGREP